MLDKLIGLLKDVIDYDTLIIVGLILLAFYAPAELEHVKMVIGGLLAFLGLKRMNNPTK